MWFSLCVSLLGCIELLGSISCWEGSAIIYSSILSAPFSHLCEIQLHIFWNLWYYLTGPWGFLHFSSGFFFCLFSEPDVSVAILQFSDSSAILYLMLSPPTAFSFQLLCFSVLEFHLVPFYSVHFPVKISWVFLLMFSIFAFSSWAKHLFKHLNIFMIAALESLSAKSNIWAYSQFVLLATLFFLSTGQAFLFLQHGYSCLWLKTTPFR